MNHFPFTVRGGGVLGCYHGNNVPILYTLTLEGEGWQYREMVQLSSSLLFTRGGVCVYSQYREMVQLSSSLLFTRGGVCVYSQYREMVQLSSSLLFTRGCVCV